jgi:uncharacterized protein (DUF433 family)/lambda repressor-like predicted transcriptional regulator
MIMDILEIVSNFIKSKNEVNPEIIINRLNNGVSQESILNEYNITDESLLNTLKEAGYIFNNATSKWGKYSPNSIPLSRLCEIVSEMFNNDYDISFISEKYTIPKEELIEKLEYKKFRNRWSYVGENTNQKITHKLKSYLYQLNTLKEDIEELAQYEGVTVNDIEQQLLNAKYKKFWMLEKVTAPPFAISSIKNQKIIYDLNTGEPVVLKVNGRNLFTMKQVAKILDINAKYIFYVHKDDFKKDNHFVNTAENLNSNLDLFKAVPHTEFLQDDILFTDNGLYYFSLQTNTTSSYRQKIKEIDDIKIPEDEKIENNQVSKDENVAEVLISEDKQIENTIISVEKQNVNLENFEKNVSMNKMEIEEERINIFDTLSNKKSYLNVESIVEKLNKNIGIANIAKDLKVEISKINEEVRAEGYRFDSFFEVWTKETEANLIKDAIIEINNGITLYDLSGKYKVNGKQRLLFADELRRKIEALGYKFEQKSKKWKTIQDLIESTHNNKETISPMQVQKSNSIINNKTDVSSHSKKITGKEISDKLNQGMSLRKIEEETGVDSRILRITLKNEGYKYEGLFKTWINVERKELLDKIAEEIFSKRNTIESIAKSYNIDKSELEKYLRVHGYKVGQINTQSELEILKEKKEFEIINNKNEQEIVNESSGELKLSKEDYELLKEILIEVKKNKEEKDGKRGLKVYLNTQLLERLEDYTEENNSSRSNFIEKAVEHYLSYLKLK